MGQGMQVIVYPVKDVARAKAIFGKLLGMEPTNDSPYYVGYTIGGVGGQEIGLDPNGHAAGMTGPVTFTEVPDIRRALKALLDAGATLHQDVKDVGGGKLVATVKDPDGNTIGVMQSA